MLLLTAMKAEAQTDVTDKPLMASDSIVALVDSIYHSMQADSTMQRIDSAATRPRRSCWAQRGRST